MQNLALAVKKSKARSVVTSNQMAPYYSYNMCLAIANKLINSGLTTSQTFCIFYFNYVNLCVCSIVDCMVWVVLGYFLVFF